MAAMAPALTDAPAEARQIRLKLAAASSGLSPGSAETNGNTTNLLLSSSVSSSTTAANGKRRLPPDSEDGCRSCCCNGKGQPQEPLSLGKLQPLVASYLCSDVAHVAKESLKVQGVLKSHGLLNGSLFNGSEGGDFMLRKALSGGGQVKCFVNGGGAVGAGGSAMVPVNGLAKKVAVPSTALPEKGCVATVNGDNAKPLASGEALLPLSSKSGDVVPLISAPRGDAKHHRESAEVFSRAQEETGFSPASADVKSETDCAPSSGWFHSSKAVALTETNSADSVDPQTFPDPHCPSPTSSLNLEALLQERAQQSRRRHTDISGRLQRLCKRLQVVQAKQVERHVRQQLSGFLDRALTQSSAFSHRDSLHTDSLGNFLKGGFVPSELEKLHLSGSTNLRTAEAQFDSDATESSSGGESDVEEEELSRVDIEQRHVKLWRRAEGRFALERASIISRWTWLQAQISDLEYRIRQQADIYRQIRNSKVSQHSVERGVCVYLFPSPSSDMSLSVQLQSVLKSHWQSRRIEKLKPLKKLSLKHKLSLFSSSTSPALSKHKFRLSSSHMAAVSKYPLLLSLTLLISQRVNEAQCLVLCNCCWNLLLIHLTLILSSSLNPLCHTLSCIICLTSSIQIRLNNNALASGPPIRKRRSENSFDINNIVIPMSVAATTRVEKLQYKEIITPRYKICKHAIYILEIWREVDVLFRPLDDEDEDVEDMSDAAFAQLHQKCEDQERSRWRWTALAPATRRGSRSYKSLDGRTTPSLSGTNPSTPQPSSPDTGHFHLLQDYGPVPSPLSPPSPDTPCSRDAHTPHSRDTNRLYSEDTRCSTPDFTYEERMVQPWEHRSFPLSEDPAVEPNPDNEKLPPGFRNRHCRAASESEESSP
uniref:PEHE domain-containing protein n=1 Tax=Pygocentrus nattereri TaxID=42514 RepID=A0AAR2K9J6_PYGNA